MTFNFFLFKYIGTFAVTLSGSFKDGETTLTTHKERTRFVKKKLREYRVSFDVHLSGWVFKF